MANEKNLIPPSERTPDERRENARKAGIASGAARRRKRSMREAAEFYLSLPVADRRKWNKLAAKYIDPEDIDNQMAMIAGLVDRASEGDAAAAKVVLALIGAEDPSTKQLDKAKELLGGVDSAID